MRFMLIVGTLPMEFPKKFNTCGRIALDPTGQYASDRNIDSLIVYFFASQFQISYRFESRTQQPCRVQDLHGWYIGISGRPLSHTR